MIIPDINLLVFAYNKSAPQHGAARNWWENCLNGSTPVGLPWIVINGFLRLMTHYRVLAEPMKIHAAVACVENWLIQPSVNIIQPGSKFSFLFFNYLKKLGVHSNLTTDASLAALTLEHKAELHSHDNDFSRFPGLCWKNPLNALQ